MLFRFPKIIVILAAASFLSLASDDAKPTCNAENLGRLWPEAANNDSKLRQKMARCGELEHCTRHGRRRYYWESLTVRLDQLAGSKLARPAGCEASPEVAIEPNGAVSNPEPERSRLR
jgi:hypothetical protein